MITKISSNEYLRRVDNMSVAERESYLCRVGEWLERQAPLLLQKAGESVARFQNAIQCSAGWNDDECRAWEDGVRLLTAMAGKTDTWLPDMLYVKAARRVIGQMISCLTPVSSPKGEGSNHAQGEKAGMPENSGRMTDGTRGDSLLSDSKAIADGIVSGVQATPVRPKHIDQYVHLLPESTQKKAATVRGLLRDLDAARENMRLLMDDPKSSDAGRASWAKTATKIDAQVKSIYKELDREWEKLVASGRVTVDALGNARVIDNENKTVNEKDDKRREYLKKWLRDTRTKASDERRKQWEANYKELLSLGGELTDSIRKAAEHYGVEIGKPKKTKGDKEK